MSSIDDLAIILTPLKESDFALWRKSEGHSIVERQGRWWEQIRPGFWQPVHWLARYCYYEAVPPTFACWGFRATLSDSDACRANGSLPVHLMRKSHMWTSQTLVSKVRNKVRKSIRHCEFVQITEPRLLHEDGYRIRCSVYDRLGIWQPPQRDQYENGLIRYVHPNRCILGGIVGGRLVAYLDSYTVQGIAYIDHVYIHSEALHTEVGTGLLFHFIQACRARDEVCEIVYGLDTPSKPSLSEFKIKMGFPVIQVPASFGFLRPAGTLIRLLRPEAYYRLTGHKL